MDDGKLSVGLRLDGMFNRRALELIEKGFTTVLGYNVELWTVRNGWFDRLVRSRKVAFSFEFNLLEQRYTLTKLSDGQAEATEGLERGAAISAATDSVVATIDVGKALDPGDACYVVARAEREPLTTDDIESLRKWLTDMGQSKGSRESTFNRFLFRLAGDLFSSRNREVVSSQSDKFRLRELRPVPEKHWFWQRR